MKKLLLILFIIPVFAFAQTSPITPQFKKPSSGSQDSLGYNLPPSTTIKWLGNLNFIRNTFLSKSDSSLYVTHTQFNNDSIPFTRNFKLLGDTVDLADTIHKNNWVFINSSTTLPGLTIISNNGYPSMPYDFYIKHPDNTPVAGIGNTGIYFGTGISNINTGNRSHIGLLDSGAYVTRNDPNGFFMRWGDSTTNYGSFDRTGFYLKTDTANMSLYGNAVVNSEWVKAYVAAHGGSSGTDSTLYKTNGTILTDRYIQMTPGKEFLIGDTLTYNGLYAMYNSDGTWHAGVFTGNPSGSRNASFDANGAGFLSMTALKDGVTKAIVIDAGSSMQVNDNDNVGLVNQGDYSVKERLNQNSYASIKAAIGIADSVNTAHAGVSSITPGYGFTSSTPITTSGTMTTDTTKLQTVLNFFPKGDTRYYKSSNPSNYIVLTALSATSPIFYNNSTGVISSQAATSGQNGYLTSTDWSTFNGKQAALVSGTNIKTINSISLLGSGNIVISGSTQVYSEIPGGAINGSNTSFTVAHTPLNGISLFLNGIMMIPTTDYSVGGTTITTVVAPVSGDNLMVNYSY